MATERRAPTRDAAGGRRLLLLACAALLVLGVWAGLARLGIAVGRPPAQLVGGHGPLVALGVLGSLIALERAVALGRRLAFAPPLAAVAGAGALVVASSPVAGQLLLAAGGLGLVAVFVELHRRQPAPHFVVMGIGAALWPGAVAVWAVAQSVVPAVPWLAGFLVLTIVGERLELSRIVQHSAGTRRVLSAAIGLLLLGLVVGLLRPDLGARLAGLGMLGQAVWLLRHDLAPRALRRGGLQRYMGAALTVGYVWLGVAGAMWAVVGVTTGGPLHDAAVHALFLGFVVSMVLGHAPVILPALLRLRIPYRPVLYLPLVLLHTSLALRVAGDLLAVRPAVVGGGVGNAIALACVPAAVLWARRGERGGEAVRTQVR